MMHCKFTDFNKINQSIRKDKVTVGKSLFITSGGSLGETEIVLWESHPNSDEKSSLIVENYVSISSGCRFFLGGNHRNDWFCQHLLIDESITKPDEVTSSGDILIGNDVWIGYGAIILSGTIIPDGCVIGAGAVVKGNFAPYDVIVGNPAKAVKKRFSDDIIDILSKLKWWNWDDEKIKKYSDILKSSNLEELKKLL